MEPKMIVIENYCDRHEHARYNSAYLNEVSVDQSESILIFCSNGHRYNLIEHFEEYGVNYDNFQFKQIPPLRSKITSFSFVFQFFVNLYIYCLIRKKSNLKRVTFPTASSSNILFSYLFLRSFDVNLHAHAIINSLYQKPKFFNRLFWIRKYMKFLHPKLRITCLSISIQEKLSHEFGADIFDCCPYPYWKVAIQREARNYGSDLRVGYIGNMTPEKGKKFIEDSLLGNYANLKIIQFSSSPSKFPSIKQWEDLSPHGFSNFMKYIDLVILPYDTNFYKCAIAGTFYDCVGHSVPVLSVPFDFIASDIRLAHINFNRENFLQSLEQIRGYFDLAYEDQIQFLQKQEEIYDAFA